MNENEALDNAVQAFLEDLGLGYLWDKIAPILNEIKAMADSFNVIYNPFRIPSKTYKKKKSIQ